MPEFYDKWGTLYVEWADNETEIYEGKFRDYPDKVILLDAYLVKSDTLVSDTLIHDDWFISEDFIDSLNLQGSMKYRYLLTEDIKAMKTSLIKAQMKRVWIE